jgi:O-antigen biosynthesis protein
MGWARPDGRKPVDGSTWVAQLELGSFSPVTGVCRASNGRDDRARILVRLHGEPLGFLDLAMPAQGLQREAVAREAWEQFEVAVRQHLVSDDVGVGDAPESWRDLPRTTHSHADPAAARPLSVVVCSRNRPALVEGCLRNLRSLRYRRFEVVLVDSASDGDATWASFRDTVGDDERFRYVREHAPGLSRARNRGLVEASFDHVVFTDDDTLVDPLWLDGIDRGFARGSEVACVTGLVPSAALESKTQRYFDRRVSWSARLAPRVYDLERGGDTPLFPFDAGRFGTGANFGVDRRFALEIGGFDDALGAGSLTRGGEDLDLFLRVLQRGRAIAYEPSAVVWHLHRASSPALHSQLFDFGVGLGAYLTKHLSDPVSRPEMLRGARRGMLHLGQRWQEARAGNRRHVSLVAAEVCGVALGPLAWRRARARERRSRES